MGIKQEFRELYLALSDYDFRLFRTFRHLLSEPRTVLESPRGNYTPALRYALTLLSGSFLALWLIDNPDFLSSAGSQELWIFPARIQEQLHAVDQYQQNFAFLTLLALWVPVFLILMKLFFWKDETWPFFYRTSLYFSATFFLPFPFLYGFAELFDLPHLVHILMILLWAGLLFYQFVTLGLNRWYVSLLKGSGILIGCMFFLGQLAPFLHKSAVRILLSQDTYYEMPSSEHLVEKQIPVSGYTHSHIVEADMTGARGAFLLSEQALMRLDGNRISWKQPLPYTPAGLVRIPEHHLVVTNQAEIDSTMRFDLVSYKGKHRGHYTVSAGRSFGDLNLVGITDTSVTLGVMSNELKLLTLLKEEGRWQPQPLRSVAFAGRREPTTVRKLGGDRGYLAGFVTYSNRTLSGMGIARFNSAFTEKWSREVYRRNSPYLPIDLLEFNVDRDNEVLYTYYSLANDTLVETHVEAISLADGHSLWIRKHAIPAGVIDLHGMAMDGQHLFFYGEAQKRISRNPWTPEYHIGLVSVIDRTSGDMLGYRFFGLEQQQAHARVEDLYQSNGFIHLLSADSWQVTPLQAIVSEPDTLFFKSVPLEALVTEQP